MDRAWNARSSDRRLDRLLYAGLRGRVRLRSRSGTGQNLRLGAGSACCDAEASGEGRKYDPRVPARLCGKPGDHTSIVQQTTRVECSFLTVDFALVPSFFLVWLDMDGGIDIR